MKNKPAAMQEKERIENNMPRQKKINNELINQKNSENDSLSVCPSVRKRGRPKGSKNLSIRKDYQLQTEQGDNAKILEYTLSVSSLPAIDINNLGQVKQRITDFFRISKEHDIKPAVATLALSLGCNRITLFNWLTERSGTIKNKECLNTIKNAYDIINSQYEIYMNTGKINPVAGIFLMKNNMGYKDTTDHIITANNNTDPTTEDITSKAGLLD